MAGYMRITAQGLANAEARMAARVWRLKDLSPVMKTGAALITKLTDDAFARSKSPKGESFPDIKDATKLARAPKKAKRRTKKGELTSSAKAFRAKLLSSGGSKPLISTGRARNSQRAKGTKKEIRWSAVGYLAPHITGGKPGGTRPPKRNVSVFEGKPGAFRLVRVVAQRLTASIARYIETGRP